jgi:hypothetical protein
VKFVPLIVTDVPLSPDVGVNDVMVGNCEEDAVDVIVVDCAEVTV